MHTIIKVSSILFVSILSVFFIQSCHSDNKAKSPASEKGNRHRVLVSSDIGGTDPDDFQSMVHLLLYADTLDIEGIISSPYGPGKKEHILTVIDQYEKDFPNLKTYSANYPTADSLRQISKQGSEEMVGYRGISKPSEGSEWIIQCARRDDPRPLYVLVWGGLEDLTLALHDAPDILPKLRVFWIGGPNKKWSPDAYQYIVENHPDLWIIESNATYRGWFTGGDQSAEWSNDGFAEKYIKDHGAMGNFFMTQLGGTIKMGDTPSLAWVLNSANPEDPTTPNWGGQYIKAWDRPYDLFTKMPTERDSIQEFAILEIALPIGTNLPEKPEAYLNVDNQSLSGHFAEDETVRFRFSPKSAKTFAFEIKSNIPDLNGKTGKVTAVIPSPELANQPSDKYSNWWTDNPNPEFMVGDHIGAKTVSKWRKEFLTDFASRMDRCQTPNR
ncbi:DUF1593 domain-containing protein [Sunxiuqinia indica]|uniref:DUF1593 domain-containing protein n=1 Tax=Sunxiuqinia indica TaxID=2692584 RepID=UPI0013584E84|nr:DUF1593 domain-containing protein [Sunxiuqinia indica]